MEHLICKPDELPPGEVRLVTIDSIEIGIFRQGDAYFAYQNVCPHQGGPACEGLRMPQTEDKYDSKGLFVGQCLNEDDMHIVCPWHGYEFHLTTGEHVRDANVRLRKFPVTIKNEGVYVTL
jgi:nitrite reductase/ring-hydroxylating ferredoxin subunit